MKKNIATIYRVRFINFDTDNETYDFATLEQAIESAKVLQNFASSFVTVCHVIAENDGMIRIIEEDDDIAEFHDYGDVEEW